MTLTDHEAEQAFSFADMFCGIGGFHVAASELGMRCVFACDIDAEARRAYRQNFGIEPDCDITGIRLHKVGGVQQHGDTPLRTM